MALDYTQSADLMKDPEFIGRVKVACLVFANYILGEPVTQPAHNTRVKWAQYTLANPDAAAAAVTPVVVMDPAVQSAGAAITDTALQGAVENAVAKMI